jgi:DNA-binding NarL/FixJ family response regulator
MVEHAKTNLKEDNVTDNLSDSISLPPIVVIDDDPEDLELIRVIGKKLHSPNEVLLFSNPLNALDYLQRVSQAPALIICDVNMPKINGFQFRTKLLEAIPAFLKVPFFFLSTSKSPFETKSAEDLNVDGYYQKSESFDGLRDTLQTMLVFAGITI